MKLIIDGEEREVNLVLSSVGLGAATGAGLKIFPGETPLDKTEFSVLIARDLGRFQMTRLLSKLPKGKHVGHPKIDFLKATTVEFSAENKMPVEADGEYVGDSPRTPPSADYVGVRRRRFWEQTRKHLFPFLTYLLWVTESKSPANVPVGRAIL